jgi:predicted membrane protein
VWCIENKERERNIDREVLEKDKSVLREEKDALGSEKVKYFGTIKSYKVIVLWDGGSVSTTLQRLHLDNTLNSTTSISEKVSFSSFEEPISLKFDQTCIKKY